MKSCDNTISSSLDTGNDDEPNHTKQTTWEKHSSGFATKMLNKMGYKSKGLVREENGITEPISVQKQVFKVDNNKQKRKLVFILSDSIQNQMDKERRDDKYEVKLESHGGCTIEGMYTHHQYYP